MKHQEFITKFKYRLPYVKKFILIFLLLFILVFNIVYSQFITPLYIKFTYQDRGATISYLQKIKDTKYYSKQISRFKNIYDPFIESEVNQQEILKNEESIKLEQILKLNPLSRDVLYRIYQLKADGGNNPYQNDLLIKIREIDPTINN